MTHTIMSGGRLHVPEDLYDEFLGVYAREIEMGNKTLTYSERRTPDVFRMYFDLDILEHRAVNEGEMLEIVREVQATTALFFVGSDDPLKCIVSRTQTKQVEVRARPPQAQKAAPPQSQSADSATTEEKKDGTPDKPGEALYETFTKNGVHLNFPKLLVNLDMALQIRFSVVNRLEKRFGKRSISHNPWSDVIDKAPYFNGLKMTGSVKTDQCKKCNSSKKRKHGGDSKEEERLNTIREIARIRRKHYNRDDETFDYTNIMSFEGDEFKNFELAKLHAQYHTLTRMCSQCNNKGWFLEERFYSPTHVLGTGGVLLGDDLHYIANNCHEQMRWTSIRARTHDKVTPGYNVPAGHLRPPEDTASACLSAFGSSGLEWVSPGLYREMINSDVHVEDAKGISRWRGSSVQDEGTLKLIEERVRKMHANYKNVVVKEAIEIKTGKQTSDNSHKITSGPAAGMVVRGKTSRPVENMLTKVAESNNTTITKNVSMRVYTTFVVRVSGEGSKFCQNKGDEHTSNSVYFCISKSGMYQMCHSGKDNVGTSGKVCKRYRSSCKDVGVDLNQKLFPDEFGVDMQKVNASIAKRPVVAGKRRRLSSKTRSSVTMWNRLATIGTKTPCGKGYRINPRTGRCVTLGYLLSLNPDDYDTDYDDDSAAEILFTPTDLSTGAGVVTPYDNSVTKDSEHFKSNTLTENDLVVMGAAYRASEVGMQFRKTIAGVYSPKERKECIEMTKKQGFKPAIYSECGLKEVQSYDKTSTDPAVRKIDIARMIAANSQLDENKFVFVTDEYRTLNPHLLTELGEVANRHPVRLLIANFYGVWRILIPKVKDAAKSTLPTSIMAINDQAKLVESAGHINFRKFALKVHGVVKAFDNIHVSFAPYPETEDTDRTLRSPEVSTWDPYAVPVGIVSDIVRL
eukprot:g14168.t1